MYWVFALVALASAGLTLWVLWRRDRPWKGIGHFSGLVSISVAVGIVVYLAVLPFLIGLAWWVMS